MQILVNKSQNAFEISCRTCQLSRMMTLFLNIQVKSQLYRSNKSTQLSYSEAKMPILTLSLPKTTFLRAYNFEHLSFLGQTESNSCFW